MLMPSPMRTASPAPQAVKVGIIIGTHRAGILGGIAAWFGFTMPSALILIAFGLSVNYLSGNITNASWLHGLQIAAVAIVFQAVLGMGKRLVPDVKRAIIAGGATIGALALEQFAGGQVLIIIVSGVVGWAFLRHIPMPQGRASIAARIPRWLSISSLVILFGLLGVIPILEQIFPSNHVLAVFYAFYSSGALVFGGGHVVLPLLRSQIVAPGWVSSSQFLAGYGLTQAMPGPIFTFSAYLGTVLNVSPNGIGGGFFALFAIFLPSFLLVYGPLPFWNSFRSRRSFQSALAGVNAGVVGILLAALYNPIFTTAVTSVGDFVLAIGLILVLIVLKRPPWNIVLIAAAGGLILGFLGLI